MTDAVTVGMGAFSDLLIETQPMLPMPAGPEGEVKRAETPRGGWKSPKSRREAADELMMSESPAAPVATAVDLVLPERSPSLQLRSSCSKSPGGGRTSPRGGSRPGSSGSRIRSSLRPRGGSSRPTTTEKKSGVQIAIVLPAVAADAASADAASATAVETAGRMASPAAAAAGTDGTPSPSAGAIGGAAAEPYDVPPPLSKITAVDILLPDEAASPTRARTASSSARPSTGASRAMRTVGSAPASRSAHAEYPTGDATVAHGEHDVPTHNPALLAAMAEPYLVSLLRRVSLEPDAVQAEFMEDAARSKVCFYLPLHFK